MGMMNFRDPQSGTICLRGQETEGLESVLHQLALRVLPRVSLCDELFNFLSVTVSAEDRARIRDSLVASAGRMRLKLDLSDCPPTANPQFLTRLFRVVNANERHVELLHELRGAIDSALGVGGDCANGRLVAQGDLAVHLAELGRIFGLGEDELSILLFYFAICECDDLCTLYHEFSTQLKPAFISFCVGIGRDAIPALLSRKATLIRSGLLERDDDDSLLRVGISAVFVDYLSGIGGGLTHERLCESVGEARYEVGDFSVGALELSISRTLLTQDNPVNILLYGAPGTGKTEFAKSLARSCGLEAWLLGEGEMGGAKERKTALVATMASLDAQKEILIVDEADTLLGVETPYSAMSSSPVDKSWINGFLQAPTRKIIWIVNWTEILDESVKRRFAFSVRFERFSPKERARLWASCAAERGIGLEDGLVTKLAEGYDASAAGIAQALDILGALRSGKASAPVAVPADDELVLRAALESQDKLLKGEVAAPVTPVVACYDPTVLNCDTPVTTLAAAIETWKAKGAVPGRRGLRMLFWGPPGTGKTELCKYLAKVSGLGLVVKRASDIMDKFVGGTEKNIADAFAEAVKSDAILLLDEADTFLRSRGSASHSWEVSAVNEFLTQIESHPGVIVACTNFLTSLDPASLRRFHFKVGFEPLEGKAIVTLVLRRWPELAGDGTLAMRAASLAGFLTAGDVAAAADRLEYTAAAIDAETVFDELGKECEIRKPRGRIGFAERASA